MRSVDVWAIDADGSQRLSTAFSHRSEPIYELFILEMAAARGWDTVPVLAARDACIDAGVESVYDEWVRISGPTFTAWLDLDLVVPDFDPLRAGTRWG